MRLKRSWDVTVAEVNLAKQSYSARTSSIIVNREDVMNIVDDWREIQHELRKAQEERDSWKRIARRNGIAICCLILFTFFVMLRAWWLFRS